MTDLNLQGIDVRAVATTIAANSANRNTSLGINAIAGVVDGGGNTASGNGDPRQCVGVVCAPSDRPPSDLVPVDPQLPAAGAALPVRATVAFTG